MALFGKDPAEEALEEIEKQMDELNKQREEMLTQFNAEVETAKEVAGEQVALEKAAQEQEQLTAEELQTKGLEDVKPTEPEATVQPVNTTEEDELKKAISTFGY